MRGTKGAAATAVAAVSVLALAACGPLGSSSSGADKPAAPATTAAQGGDPSLSGVAHAVAALDLVKKAASGVHSAKVDSTISVGTAMSTKAKGAMDWGSGLQGDMVMTYTGGTAAKTLRDSGAPTTMDARYLPDAYYVNMGSAMAAQLGGKHWIEYTYDDLARISGSSGAFLKDTIQNNNPVKSVDAALASPNMKAVGTDSVRGVRATHYTGTVDLTAITGKTIPNLSTEDQAQLRESLTKSGVTTETIDLWVSQDNLPVESVVTAATKAGVMKTATYYSDFGTPVTVKRPPAYDTADFADLMKQQQAG